MMGADTRNKGNDSGNASSLADTFRLARQQLEERATSGDLAGAYDKWLRILHVEGECYRAAVNSDPPDYRAAAGAALGGIVATSAMIPVEPQNLPALHLLEALSDMILDAANGAKKHPILLNRAHLHGHNKGVTMGRKRLQTLAVFCAKLLLRWGDSYSHFLIGEFGRHGVIVKDGTLRAWLHRARDEPFGGAQADGILADSEMRKLLDQIGDRQGAEVFCSEVIAHWLGKRRVAMAP